MRPLLHCATLSLAASFFLACNTAPPPPPTPDPRVAELEKTVADLRTQLEAANTRLDGEVMKMQAIAHMHDFDGDPLKNFFNSPEFWENTWNSGNGDCCKRCADEAKAERDACAKITDAAKRRACYADAAQRVAACVDACSARFPQSGSGGPAPHP